MGNVGKRKSPFAARKKASHPGKSAANPFEAVKGKQRFNVIGRKSASTKNINKARSDAVDMRKRTLMVEYKQLKKANAFVDKRIGEHDDTLTEDEKAIARFQQQRLKQARKSKFTLMDEQPGEQEGLTHLGNPLATLADLKDEIPLPDDDDCDDDLSQVQHYSPAGAGSREGQRSKREVMAEVMAVSKAARAEKRILKEQDEDLLEAIDAKFQGIVETSTFRSLKRAPGEPVPKAPKRLTNSKATPHDEVENDPIYDAVRMEAASDARAQAAERALTDDERAERERVRVQELEASRKLAAKTDNAGNSDAAEAAAALVAARAMGGYAGRRQVARLEAAQQEKREAAARDLRQDGSEAESSDEDEEDEGDAGDTEMGTAHVDKYPAAAAHAAGDDPLQKGFRSVTAQLLLKYGGKPSEQSLKELQEDTDGDSSNSSSKDMDDSGQQSDVEGRASQGEEERRDELHNGQGAGKHVHVHVGGRAAAALADRSLHAGAEEEDDFGLVLSDAEEIEESDEDAREGAQRADELDTENAGSEEDEDALAAAEVSEDEAQAILQQIDQYVQGQASANWTAAGAGGVGSSDDEAMDADDSQMELLMQAIAIKRAQLSGGASAQAIGVHGAGPVDDGRSSDGDVSEHSTQDGADDVVPYTPAVPQDADDLAQMTKGLSTRGVAELVRRIRMYNANALNANGRVGLQELCAVLIRRYAVAAAERPIPQGELQGLSGALGAIVPEVPLYTATLIRAHLKTIFEKARGALDGAEDRPTAWPASSTLLQLRLFALLFPTSAGPYHATSTPLALVCGFLLSYCPPAGLRDVAVGLLLCALLLSIEEASGRVAAEILPFCEALLYSATKKAVPVDSSKLSASHVLSGKRWLAGAAESDRQLPQSLSFWEVAAMGLHSSNSHSSKGCRKAFKAQCIHTCLNLIQSQMHLIDEHANASLEAAMLPTRKALTHFTLNGAASSALKKHAKRLLTDIDGAVGESISSRVAPVCADVVQKNPKKLLNPKFEVDFDKRRDYDPDRERAEYKQYKRMAAKEKRALKRELAADSLFMGEVRRQRKVQTANARDVKAKRAIAFLEQQESDFKSGGQGGMNPHKKKKK